MSAEELQHRGRYTDALARHEVRVGPRSRLVQDLIDMVVAILPVARARVPIDLNHIDCLPNSDYYSARRPSRR
jgi:hypothetical protein